jgi:hypothetical protein
MQTHTHAHRGVLLCWYKALQSQFKDIYICLLS